jgi:mono/diheme cytochrome c family protein
LFFRPGVGTIRAMRNTFAVVVGLAILLAAVAGVVGQAQQPAPAAPTFSKDVAPILYKNCVSCHRPGEIGRMPLLTYEQARPYAKAISNAVTNRTMPPWHAEAPAGTFHNERILSDAERQTLTVWAASGAVNGEPSDLPAQPTFSDGWALGKPDVVLEMQEDYHVPAKGTVQYEWLYIPTNFTEAKWVKSLEIRPGDRSVVHHVLIYYRAKPDGKTPPIARANQRDQSNPPPDEPGVSSHPRRNLAGMPPRLLATYAPGTNPQVAPAGTAFRLEPGGVLELQMHYTATGQPTTDRTKVGITFSTEPSPREVRAQHFMNMTLKLPAGAADVAVTTDMEFLQDATVWGLFPHTHLRGKRWAYTLELPGGEKKSILAVPRYDFNWQTYYMFTAPLRVPKGSRIISTAWYDNSAANKSNPNPKVDVFWGDQTWQEMQYTGVLLSPN